MALPALAGLKVLDLTQTIAGPFCTKLLADHGAYVIKVERPGGGDPARWLPPFVGQEPHGEKGVHFLYLNTNKRGVTLDLKTDSGREMLRALANRDLLDLLAAHEGQEAARFGKEISS